MEDLAILAAPILLLALAWSLWRAGSLFLCWNPASATVRRSGRSALDREEDWRLSPFGAESGSAGDMDVIDDLVAFTDAEGNRRRATVYRAITFGWPPDSVFIIWYDPDDPRRATAFGPAHWLGAALLAAAALAALIAW